MPIEKLFTLAVILALKSVDSEHENSQKKRKDFRKDSRGHNNSSAGGGDEEKNTGSFWAMSSGL